MSLKYIALAAALGLCGFASHASAAIVTVNYVGTVTDDSDLTGEFGVAGGFGNLTGDTYSATYVFDTSLGITFSFQGYTIILGGTSSQYGVSPIISNSVTINGYTESLSNSNLGEVVAGPPNGGSVGQEVGNFLDGTDIHYDQFSSGEVSGIGLATSTLISGPFTFYPTGNEIFNELTYHDEQYDYDTGNYLADTEVDASVTSVTVSSVPEPSAWALMLLGFAGLGFVGYRKRKVERAAVAAI